MYFYNQALIGQCSDEIVFFNRAQYNQDDPSYDFENKNQFYWKLYHTIKFDHIGQLIIQKEAKNSQYRRARKSIITLMTRKLFSLSLWTSYLISWPVLRLYRGPILTLTYHKSSTIKISLLAKRIGTIASRSKLITKIMV